MTDRRDDIHVGPPLPARASQMFSLLSLKRVLLVLPSQRLAMSWSDAERERSMTLVGLDEATRLLGAKVADLAEVAHAAPVVSSARVSPGRG